MNKKIYSLLMIAASITAYGYGDDPVYPTPNYRILSSEETLEPIERSSYDNLLRVVDEINRKNGNPTEYLGKSYKVQKSEEDKIKFVTVAQTEYGSDYGNFYRFYLGNGNEVKDLSIVTKDNFDKISKIEGEKKNIAYLIEGAYQNKSQWVSWSNSNSLGITLDDYKTKMVGKPKEEVLTFLAEKLKENNINAVAENGDLYSIDSKNQKWKILWNVEPVSNVSYWPEGYKDGLFANFYVFDDKDFGRELYTKSKDIIIENQKNNEIKDKKIQLRGRGKIDGTVDFGKNSEVTITEQFTGKYGTNIVFSPYAKLKNVKAVLIGGMIGNIKDASLSGRTSVTMDIDTTKKDKDGNLYQHMLKDTDKDTIFVSSDSILDRDSYSWGEETQEDKERKKMNRDNYAIEVATSRLNEETKIDLGRKVKYKATSFSKYKPNEVVEYNLKFIPDSIANQLEVEERENDKGDLLVVKIKDNLKQLDQNENDVYRSIKNGKQLANLRPTLSNTNKRTVFTAKEDEKFAMKLNNLSSDLRSKSVEEVFNNLDEFGYTGSTKKKILEDIEKIQKSPELVERKQKSQELAAYKKENVFKYLKDFSQIDLKSLPNFRATDDEADKVKQKIQNFYDNHLQPLANVLSKINEENHGNNYYDGLKIKEGKELATQIMLVKETLASYGTSSWRSKSESLKDETIKYLQQANEKLIQLSKIDDEILDKRLIEQLDGGYGSMTAKVYKNLLGELLYTQREDEALAEFKTLIGQVQNKNIYSKVNKISKDEIDTYTNIPFNLHHDFTKNKLYVGGGAVTNRNSMDDFKGNIYTGYGIYERALDEKLNVGMMVGGASTSHNEIKNDTLQTVTTTSKIKGYSGYLSLYSRYRMMPQVDLLAGLGGQYGSYNVDRDFRNNYQSDTFKGHVKTLSLNGYTGIVYKYDIMEDLQLQTQGILSYTMVNQGKVSEDSKPLALDIAKQNYNYLDGQVGVNLVKNVPGETLDSSISGGVYLVHGFAGYDNKDLNAKFKGSSSDFKAKGMKYKKDAVKVFLDYNVNVHNGISYGLEGTYITNSEKDNISIGVKAGYKF